MRIILITLAALFIETGWLYAGMLDQVVVQVNNYYTNASVNQANSSKYRGYVNQIDTWYANSTSTCHVVLLSSNEFTGKSVTLYSSGARTATGVSFPYRLNGCNSSGTQLGTNGITKYAALDDKLYLLVTNAVYSNQTINARIIYERP